MLLAASYLCNYHTCVIWFCSSYSVTRSRSPGINSFNGFLMIRTLVLYILLIQFKPSQEQDEKEKRNYLGVFTVVKFANDACQGSQSINSPMFIG